MDKASNFQGLGIPQSHSEHGSEEQHSIASVRNQNMACQLLIKLYL
jgi:hypothetical protein